ncbi:hypothetical protein CcaverHIS002_0103630 [Cutaneotrichosporon cavernicola]|uniref:F-box domain-containing protein n=1 Tax=Cutaneotrichosporon cavernicola TaxID=279322 RepID=A0AA48L1W9_9TREE|nr:uncharacterized protein CcaverHIS019_0103560 [Cutaneotrichosporon cavernicola]BEI79834.1 hypothetical protein CcaverHIS002_0103630 [Cutaneotrichosporon cavernicola]BEI87638.1 hypothetical protein CcaverHIS019_0103560 [Cutaneotrichosporon cavernicola]BEI95410.1 hypothetical protein CcaverHIS631_0103590 [Cutaneotrichosporon cavernicola]BEJ03184.1 hypothetical protein CcaverHIS641_0103590 [Cutaneotrichosporon cavernicola]
MPSQTLPPPKKRKKWSLSAFCIGEVPEEHNVHIRRPSLILQTRPYTPPASVHKTVSASTAAPKHPVRPRTIRFQDPLPVPRTLITPCKDILVRVAYFCDSQNLRKLRSVSREMRSIAEGILLRHVQVGRRGVLVVPPPGGTRCWAPSSVDVDDAPALASLTALTMPRPSAKEKALVTVKEAPESGEDEETLSLWAQHRHSIDERDEDAPWSDSDTDAESDDESLCSNEPSSFSTTMAASCKGLHLPPAANVTFILPTRSRLMRKIRVADIQPEAEVAVLRRLISVPPPIARALPGASGTLTSDTVIVFSRSRDDVPPAYPRPALTTSSARTVITNLLDAEGTEGLEGLSCGMQHTIIIITPATAEAKAKKEETVEATDEDAEVATLVDVSRYRSLSPATTAVASPEQAMRQKRLLEEDADPHRLIESLATNIARLLPESDSTWTIVGAESWPSDWVNGRSGRKLAPNDGRDMQDALRALVSDKFAEWASEDSAERLHFVSRADWAREVGNEVYRLASEL